MTPAQYEASEQAFIAAHPSLFQPGDILDPCPEPENGLYWIATYGHGWTASPPNVATKEYNAFIRATTTIADQTLHAAGIYGVITTVRSTNSFFATHPGDLEPATVALLGHVTFDSYPEGTTTDPATAAAALGKEFHAFHVHGHRWRFNGRWDDTLVIGPAMSLTFDYVEDNPGTWLYHCHVTGHMMGGMMGRYIVTR